MLTSCFVRISRRPIRQLELSSRQENEMATTPLETRVGYLEQRMLRVEKQLILVPAGFSLHGFVRPTKRSSKPIDLQGNGLILELSLEGAVMVTKPLSLCRRLL